jgi:hypothetical protein
MKDRQFSIARLLVWVVVFGLVCALAFTNSPVSIVVAAAGLSSILGINYYRMVRRTVSAVTLAGFAFPTMLWFSFVANVVREARIVQGELYDEDGPAVFLVCVAFFSLISGAMSALLFGTIALVVKSLYASFFSSRFAKKASDEQ